MTDRMTDEVEIAKLTVRMAHTESELVALKADFRLMSEKLAKVDLTTVEIAAAVKQLNDALKPTVAAVEKLNTIANRAIGGGMVLGGLSGFMTAMITTWWKSGGGA